MMDERQENSIVPEPGAEADDALGVESRRENLAARSTAFSGAFMRGEDPRFENERGPRPEPFDAHTQLPGEYEIGRLIREAVDMDAGDQRFYLTCSVGELAQRICGQLRG